MNFPQPNVFFSPLVLYPQYYTLHFHLIKQEMKFSNQQMTIIRHYDGDLSIPHDNLSKIGKFSFHIVNSVIAVEDLSENLGIIIENSSKYISRSISMLDNVLKYLH